MITFGGEPAGGMLANTLRFFAENYPDIFKNVVVGNDFFRSEEALAAKSENTRILCGLNADGILDIMLRSDIAVCGGGQTLYEMAAAGLSAVTIRLAENQRFNIEGWERAGFADYAGGYAEKDILQKVGKSVEKLKSRDERARRSAAGRLYSDGLGARRVVEAVLDRIERMKR
jgi:spore coat polysaccharide biosynthesis predicted glycosyltransferase SpsG